MRVFSAPRAAGMARMQEVDGPVLARTDIYRRLRAEVLSCALRPGQQFQERDLVARFGVSKSPIRDALIKLEAQGLVEVLPRKGYRVPPIDLRDVKEMYELRQMHERACIQGMIGAATAETFAGLDAYRAAPDSSDLAAWVDYNRRFHAFIAGHCGNRRLARMAVELIEEFDRLTYFGVAHTRQISTDAFVAEHCAIIDAIQARDSRKAVALARQHVESSRRRVLDNLETAPVVRTRPGAVV